MDRQFRMNVGKTIEEVLECRNERMRNVIDHYGEEVSIRFPRTCKKRGCFMD